MSSRVGTSPSSTNPVRNVPLIAPTVPIADRRPRATRSTRGRSGSPGRSSARPPTRIAAGGTKPDGGEDDDRGGPVAQSRSTDEADHRHRRHRRQPAEDERRAEQSGPAAPGRPAARPAHAPRAMPGEDHADDPGVGRQRHADVRREQPAGGDLEDEDAGGGEERQDGGDGRGEARALADGGQRSGSSWRTGRPPRSWIGRALPT